MHESQSGDDRSHKKKTRKKMHYASLVLATLRAGTAAALALSTANVSDVNGIICQTEACRQIASLILAALAPNHTSYDPCNQFDQLVCSGWEAQHDLKPTQSKTSTLLQLQDENDIIMRSYLESEYSGDGSDPDRENFRMAQDFYQSCMGEEQLKKVGVQPLVDVLDKIRFLWPVEKHGCRGDDKSELTRALVYMSKNFGIEPLVRARTLPGDPKDPFVVYPIISPALHFLPSSSYFEDSEVMANYTVAVASMLQEAAAFPTVNMELAKKIVSLEGQIANLGEDNGEDDILEELSDIEARTSAISITDFLQAHYPDGYEKTKILVRIRGYFEPMSRVLAAADRETIQGYLMWMAVTSVYPYLFTAYGRPLRTIESTLYGLEPDSIDPRWKTCLSQTATQLRWIYGKGFVQKAFSNEAKELGDRMIGEFKDIYRERIQSTPWMTEKVKQRALLKVVVERMGQKIGYPTANPDLDDPASIKNWYGGLEMSNESYFHNTLAQSRFAQQKSWNALLAPTDRKGWLMTVPEVNAYHIYWQNEIVFPAGIMQAPLFGLKYPEYVNYGAWGMLASHEISHGFDNKGRLYDEGGRLTEWWDNKTTSAFQQRAQCFVDQYDKYQIIDTEGKPRNISGSITQAETIADAGGLRTSFAAWQKRDAEVPGELLPGLEHFTKEQLFFISFGLLWCSKARPEALEQSLSDSHPPDRARLLLNAANSNGFSEAFNCPQKTPTCWSIL
ncbi:peptidase family M13 [Paramyrothecium foliicola]|nr:peptidase family M13 [Paramyrothecium foliicola]